MVGATIAMFAAVLGLSRMATQPNMALLYAGLDAAAAGEVVAALEQQGVSFEVRSGAIFVDQGSRDSLRMTLAAEGLPANDGQGYEILDSLTGFGTTSQMFDAAYWRAKEGELARTIVSSPKIKTARVHISNPSSNPFQRDIMATASVTVATFGGAIAPAHAQALKYLVASAVAGLSPENVSIIDSRGGLIVGGDDLGSGMGGGEERAMEMRRNIQRILEARVGFGNAIVEVAVETVTEREAIVERRFDPETRVAISSDTEERSTLSSGSQNDGVSVASNLPAGDVGGAANTSRSENNETRERVNYEVSETTREVVRTPGSIKRISVAVLIDGLQIIDPTTGQTTWQPRPPDEIDALRELIASTVGFNEERGDQITLKSMEFESAVVEPPEAPAGFLSGVKIDTMSLIQLGVLSLVALILGLFVVRPILTGRAQPSAIALPSPDTRDSGGFDAGSENNEPMGFPAGPSALQIGQLNPDTGGFSSPALTGEIEDGPGAMQGLSLASPGGGDGFGGMSSADSNDPVERLRHLIQDRREETVEVLRTWMEDPEETT